MSQAEDFSPVGLRIRNLRGDLPQSEFADRLGVDRKSVAGWEAGKRLPDGSSLLKLMSEFGADVNYLLTGRRSDDVPRLTAEEQLLLGYFREASKEGKRAALGALLGAKAVAGELTMHNTAPGGIQVGHVSGGGRISVKKGK